MLTDYNNEVARKFKIAFTITDELVEIYNESHNLEKFNGVATNELPIPATFVLGRDGIIKYAFIDTDYRKRAEPEEIIAVLKTL